MVLNEKQRKKYRWLLSEDGIAKLTFAKGLLPIIGGQIFLKLLPSSLNDITGIQKPVCFIIGLLAFLLVIFGIGLILYAVFILPLQTEQTKKALSFFSPVKLNSPILHILMKRLCLQHTVSKTLILRMCLRQTEPQGNL